MLAVRYKSIQIVVLQTLHRESCEKNIQFQHCFVSNEATFDLFRIWKTLNHEWNIICRLLSVTYFVVLPSYLYENLYKRFSLTLLGKTICTYFMFENVQFLSELNVCTISSSTSCIEIKGTAFVGLCKVKKVWR